MNAEAINVGPLGRGLTAELARVRLAIVLRQVARSACLCIIWASVAGLLATSLFFLMPWVLFGSQGTLALPTTIGLSMAGAMAGCWRSLRGWNWPSSTDCALALDFGRQPRDDALATVLALPASHHFTGLILARAQAQIGHSGDLRLPPAVSTANFVAAPLLGLAAIVSVLFAMQLDPRGVELAEQAAPTQQSRTAANAGTSSSSAAELKAFEEALGLRKMQSSMEGLAADLRDEGKTQEARQASLDNARLALGKAVPVEGGGLELPAVVPSTAAARE